MMMSVMVVLPSSRTIGIACGPVEEAKEHSDDDDHACIAPKVHARTTRAHAGANAATQSLDDDVSRLSPEWSGPLHLAVHLHF
jgi:hypothetical protein